MTTTGCWLRKAGSARYAGPTSLEAGGPSSTSTTTTPAVRGISPAVSAFEVCSAGPCNIILGLAKDDPGRLRDLADYIEKSRASSQKTTDDPQIPFDIVGQLQVS